MRIRCFLIHSNSCLRKYGKPSKKKKNITYRGEWSANTFLKSTSRPLPPPTAVPMTAWFLWPTQNSHFITFQGDFKSLSYKNNFFKASLLMALSFYLDMRYQWIPLELRICTMKISLMSSQLQAKLSLLVFELSKLSYFITQRLMDKINVYLQMWIREE